jgi:hypothetical protein
LPCAAGGEFALAHERLLQALQAPIDPARWGSAASNLDLQAALLEGAAASGDTAAASRYAERLDAESLALGHRLYQALARRARGIAAAQRGDRREAESLLTQALEIFQSLGARWQEGRTLLLRSRVRAGSADEASLTDRRTAEAIFEAIGAVADAPEASMAAPGGQGNGE